MIKAVENMEYDDKPLTPFQEKKLERWLQYIENPTAEEMKILTQRAKTKYACCGRIREGLCIKCPKRPWEI